MTQTEIRHTLTPIWHIKVGTDRTTLMNLHFCLKHAAVCGLDVNVQATEKVRALLGTQRYKKSLLAMN